ncbi:MAG: hypothetical protein K8E24_014960, partial [Methanobacterium paludis]|nr:hypothetical protein [Methanobacterium paludis]
SKAKYQAEIKNYNEAINFLNAVLNFDSTYKEASDLKDQYNKEIQRIKLEEESKKDAAEKNNSTSTVKTKTAVNQSNVTSSSASGYTVKSSNGYFEVWKDNSNDTLKIPAEMFGLIYIHYGADPLGIYYRFGGNNISYEITVHLPTGTVKQSGISTSQVRLIPAAPKDVPYGVSIQIDVSVVYKGKTYTSSLWKVINDTK